MSKICLKCYKIAPTTNAQGRCKNCANDASDVEKLFDTLLKNKKPK